MSTQLKIARIAIPATLIALTLAFFVGAIAAIYTGLNAMSPVSVDTETMGTFFVLSVMSLVCAAGTGFLARVAIDDARSLV